MELYLHDNLGAHYASVVPHWLDESDPRPAAEQLNEHYQHGGGWDAFPGFKLDDKNCLKYPGDPMLRPHATLIFRDETICFYDSCWVAIIQKDRSFEVCRMD